MMEKEREKEKQVVYMFIGMNESKQNQKFA